MSSRNSPTGLDELRRKIRDNLDESIKVLITSRNISRDKTPRDFDRSDTVDWAVRLVRKAASDLVFFWEHLDLFSTVNFPEYMNVVFYRLIVDNTGNFKFDRLHITSIEKFYIHVQELGEVGLLDGRQGVQLLCSVSQDIQPNRQADTKRAPLKRVKWKFSNVSVPTAEDICQSALTAALTLMYMRKLILSTDLLSLLAAFLGSPAGDVSPLLPDIPEDYIGVSISPQRPKEIPPVLYTTVESSSVSLSQRPRLSTKTMRFPGRLPDIRSGFLHMDMWRPHGNLPDTSSRVALWGSFDSNARSWSAIAMFANPAVARTLDKNLFFTLSAHHSEMAEIVSHWNQLLRYIYAIGINDVRLSLRNAMKQLETLKYQNTAEPTINFASICAMYMNHLDYFRRLVLVLGKETNEFPAGWELYPPIWPPPDWLHGTQEGLRIVEEEISKAYTETRKMYEMVSHQHSLMQARKGTILTVLASIFVPISFVATFFGMNTREINSSAWPLRYYFMTAFPLAVLTVIVPLYFMKVVAFLARKLQERNIIIRFLTEFLLGLSFVLNIVADVLWASGRHDSVGIDTTCVIYFFLFSVPVVVRMMRAFRWCFQTRPNLATIRHHLWKQRSDIIKFFLALSFFFSITYQPFVEILFYLIYYLHMYLAWRKGKEVAKTV